METVRSLSRRRDAGAFAATLRAGFASGLPLRGGAELQMEPRWKNARDSRARALGAIWRNVIAAHAAAARDPRYEADDSTPALIVLLRYGAENMSGHLSPSRRAGEINPCAEYRSRIREYRIPLNRVKDNEPRARKLPGLINALHLRRSRARARAFILLRGKRNPFTAHETAR